MGGASSLSFPLVLTCTMTFSGEGHEVCPQQMFSALAELCLEMVSTIHKPGTSGHGM